MAGKIPDDTLQAIRERVSIVEVVSGYVSLKKAGRNYLGLCPFHAEKTPSFTVSDERGLFHCFGCGAGGTVFTFLMRADRIEFPEAVEILARRAGVTLPERRDAGPGGSQRQEFIELNEAAQRYFRSALSSAAGAVARQYLEKRGVSAATIELYGLGFCPQGGSGLARTLAGKRSTIQKAAELGLVGKRTDGSFYDRFWGRVTFPIRHRRGHILGFGGRTLGNDHPKYLNSPESVLFKKREVLYGLFEARDAIREAGRLLIVEGYLDAVGLAESGIGYAVASLGTAFTVDQLNMARPFAKEVVAFFDGDRAGRAAADRAFEVCVDAGFWGLGASLPEGFDPDTYVRTHGLAATQALLQDAKPLADLFIEQQNPGARASVPERARAAGRVADVISRMHDPFEFSQVAQRAAQILGVDELVFRDRRVTPTSARATKLAPAGTVAPSEELRPEETKLLEVMALDRDVAQLVAHRGVLDQFWSAELAAAGRAILTAWDRDHSSGGAIDQLPRSVAERVTAGLLGEGPMASGDRLQVARDCIDRIQRRVQRLQTKEMLVQLREAESSGDDARYREQLRRQNEMLRGKEAGRA